MTARVIISHNLHSKVTRTLLGVLSNGCILFGEASSVHLERADKENSTDNDRGVVGNFQGGRDERGSLLQISVHELPVIDLDARMDFTFRICLKVLSKHQERLWHFDGISLCVACNLNRTNKIVSTMTCPSCTFRDIVRPIDYSVFFPRYGQELPQSEVFEYGHGLSDHHHHQHYKSHRGSAQKPPRGTQKVVELSSSVTLGVWSRIEVVF